MSRTVRPATPDELAAWRRVISEWLGPAEFAAMVEDLRDAHGDHAIDQAGSVFRDAWVAAKCAETWEAEGVRLGADPPDFELRWGRRGVSFEVVEVQAPGRRRGDELKADRRKTPAERAAPVDVPQEAWTPAADVLAQLRRTAAAKAAVSYAAGSALIVYLNVWPVAGSAELKRGQAEALAPAVAKFKAVWILDDGRLEPIGDASLQD